MANPNAPVSGQFRPRLYPYRIIETPVTVRKMLAKRLLRAIRIANENERRAAHGIPEFSSAPDSTTNSEPEITDDEDVPHVNMERTYEDLWRSHGHLFVVFALICVIIAFVIIFCD